MEDAGNISVLNSRMVDRLSSGRVFLAGDAAHIHSPAGAQGMNTGIQDTINLAWKLAFVIHGHAAPKLLNTYDGDRVPVIREVLNKTEGLTDAIGSQSKLFRSVFSHLAPWVVEHDFVQEKATERMSQVALNYRDGALSRTAGAVGSIKAGDRVPDVNALLVGGSGQPSSNPQPVRVFDVLQIDRFTALFVNLQNSGPVHECVKQQLASWRALFETASLQANDGEEVAFQTVFGKEPGLILVRPDGYAAFTGTPTQLDALVAYFNEWFPQHSGVEA